MPKNKRGATNHIMVEAARRLRGETTTAEERLWQALRYRHLIGLKFRRQHPIGNYVLDFYCPEARLCIELDGDIHNGKDQQILDAERTAALKCMRINVLRFTNTEIEENLDQVLTEIHCYVDSLKTHF